MLQSFASIPLIAIWNVPNRMSRWARRRTTREAEGRDGRVTIVDVARHAGVSKSTVSLVLSGSSLVADADARARQRGDGRSSATSIIAARRPCAARNPACSAWSSTICRTRSSSKWRSASRTACQGGAFIPFHRQHGREPRAPACRSSARCASTARPGLAAFARDRHVGQRIEAADRRHAGRAGDARAFPASRPRSSRRRTGKARARPPRI